MSRKSHQNESAEDRNDEENSKGRKTSLNEDIFDRLNFFLC